MHYSQAAAAVALAGGGPQMRASDADREAAVGQLGAAFTEGRLTADEHEERLNAIYAARTWQQLDQLTGDLPATADSATGRRAAAGPVSGPDQYLLCLLLCLCPPAGIAWWLRSRRRRSAGPDGQHTSARGSAATAELPRPGRPAFRQDSQHAQDR